MGLTPLLPKGATTMNPPDLDPATEAEIVTFLVGALAGPVRRVDTHGARVFIGRDETLKIKRPVHLAYMDFSTREKRHAACRREVEINSNFAPDLYLGVTAITREMDGKLALDGKGAVLELAVRMRTFPEDAGLDQIAARAPLDRGICNQLGDSVAALHQAAPLAEAGRGRTLDLIRARLFASAHQRRTELGGEAVDQLEAATQNQLDLAAPILAERRAAGCVRRVHGDLHLGNIVMWQGAPTPFDAIEFDEDLATLDPIYDLAFLLMDLVHRGQREAATLVLNRYLWRLGTSAIDDGMWAALRALPLAMSLRALVRTVVTVDRVRAAGAADFTDARHYLQTAIALANPPTARLLAIGGLSGTGKSTVAAALAPDFGAAPGAIHVRSDLERKRLFGCEPAQRLGPDGYTADATARTYAMVLKKAEVSLAAGHSVIIDAVSAREDERRAIQAIAERCRVPFTGIWLTADAATLTARVANRRGDASDATVDVLARQLAHGAGEVAWTMIDASGGAAATIAAVRACIG